MHYSAGFVSIARSSCRPRPSTIGDNEGTGGSNDNHHNNEKQLRHDTPRREVDKSGRLETTRLLQSAPPNDASAPDKRDAPLRIHAPELPSERGSSSRSLSPRTGWRRRRASWSSPRGSLRTGSSARDEAGTRLVLIGWRRRRVVNFVWFHLRPVRYLNFPPVYRYQQYPPQFPSLSGVGSSTSSGVAQSYDECTTRVVLSPIGCLWRSFLAACTIRPA